MGSMIMMEKEKSGIGLSSYSKKKINEMASRTSSITQNLLASDSKNNIPELDDEDVQIEENEMLVKIGDAVEEEVFLIDDPDFYLDLEKKDAGQSILVHPNAEEIDVDFSRPKGNS